MRYFIPLLLVIFACGCTRTLTKSALDAKASEAVAGTPPGQVYYVGSDSTYDYFTIRGDTGGKTRLYSVLRTEGAASTRFSATSNEMDWRIYPAGGDPSNVGEKVQSE